MKTSIKISPLFFIMAVIMVGMGAGYQCLVYFTAVTLHEMAHAEIARRYGYLLNGIKIMPYGASLTGSFEAVRPNDEAKIALAGPVFNIIIAIICVAVWWLVPASYFFTQNIVICNVSLAVFNFLPIFPLDGGRILLALLSQKYPRQSVYKKMRTIGYIAGIVFAVLFALSIFFVPNPSLGVIAVFIIVSTIIPDKTNTYQRVYSMAFMSERLKKGLPVKEIMMDIECSLYDMSRLLNSNYYMIFLIVDRKLEVKKRVTETDLERMTLKYGITEKISRLI